MMTAATVPSDCSTVILCLGILVFLSVYALSLNVAPDPTSVWLSHTRASLPPTANQDLSPVRRVPNCTVCSCYVQKSGLKVDCSQKNLLSVPTGIPSPTVQLFLSYNQIKSLDVHETLQNVEHLIVSSNNISSISRSLISSLPNLQTLDISKNKLQSNVLDYIFSNFTFLTILNISQNELSSISPFTFYGLTAVRYLNLSYNAITTIDETSFHHLTSLIVLDLMGNNISTLKQKWFQNLKNLTMLILRKNKIKIISNAVFRSLHNLHYLDMTENNLSSLGLLSFMGLTKVQYLNMSANNITFIQEGTLRPLENLEILDMSNNPLLSINKLFLFLNKLKILFMINMHQLKSLSHDSLLGLTILKTLHLSHSPSLSRIDHSAFYATKHLQELDLSQNNLTTLPLGLFKYLENLQTVHLEGNPWRCDCYMYWLLLWLGDHIYTHLLAPSDTLCHMPPALAGHALLDALNHNMACTNASIRHYSTKAHVRMGSTALLQCQAEGSPFPVLTWITPQKLIFHRILSNGSDNLDNNVTLFPVDHPIIHTGDLQIPSADSNRFLLLKNGTLLIRSVERGDGGYYRCIASNPLNNQTVNIRLTLDYDFLVHVKIVSILVGMATSFGFLLLTLLTVFIQLILHQCGVHCPCNIGNSSPKTQQIRRILESMEHYKRQQLDRLRDNYNFQCQRIKDNCMQQMEKLRESYSAQIERLRDIRDYGTLQIDRIRENYYLQVQRVRDYSASQIDRLRENYIFQRNRIRKFSAHQLYKLRENYKLQQQHLNKILENLNLESCRNVCARTDSVVFEPDINMEPVFVPKICTLGQTSLKQVPLDSTDNSSQISAYFTPDETSELSGSDCAESLNQNREILLQNMDIKLTNSEIALHTTTSKSSNSDPNDIPQCNSLESDCHEVIVMDKGKVAVLDSNETVV